MYYFNVPDTGAYTVVLGELSDHIFSDNETSVRVLSLVGNHEVDFEGISFVPYCDLNRPDRLTAYVNSGGQTMPFVNYTSVYVGPGIVVGNQEGVAFHDSQGHDVWTPAIIKGSFNDRDIISFSIHWDSENYSNQISMTSGLNDLANYVLNYESSDGDEATVEVGYMNQGTDTLDAFMTITLPEYYNLDDTVSVFSQNGREVVLDLGELLPKQWGTVVLHGTIDPVGLSIGQFSFESKIENTNGLVDATIENNTHLADFPTEMTGPINLSSSDMVVPDDSGPITFFLQFENTTDDTMYYGTSNVYLSELLDPNSIKLLGSSELVNAEIECWNHPGCREGDDAVMQLVFSEMNLYPGGKGFVTFQMSPWSSANPGEFVALSTDVTFNCDVLFSAVLGMEEGTSEEFLEDAVYPNPISKGERLEFVSNGVVGIEVYDESGKRRHVFHDPKGNLIPAKLSSGMYMLKIFEEDRVYWSRLVIE
jgi:hypothetical protein